MSITRTITLDDLTPEEMARAFCDFDNEDQAAFLGAIWRIAKEWPGAGWCQQSFEIAEVADSDAIQAIRTLASHLTPDDLAWIAAAGADK